MKIVVDIPDYVVPTGNFEQAYLLGVPCKVLGLPYKKSNNLVIDVKSTVTGLKYTIPYEWCDYYDSLVQANEDAHITGHHFAEVKDLLGKKYWPRDNSYAKDFSGNHAGLYRKECEIISLPFKDWAVESCCPEVVHTFILVKFEGRIYRVLFQEWGLIEP